MQELDIPTVRDLEDLLIDAIYQNVIKGNLDQQKKQVDVEYAMGRDILSGDIARLTSVLDNWYAFSFPRFSPLIQNI